jgi:hypothetical protein
MGMIDDILSGKWEEVKKKLSKSFKVGFISYTQKKLNEGFRQAIINIRNEGKNIRSKNSQKK